MGQAGFWICAALVVAGLAVVSLVLGDPTVRTGPPERGVSRALRARTGHPGPGGSGPVPPENGGSAR